MLKSERYIRFAEQLRYPYESEWATKPIRLLNWQKDFARRLLDYPIKEAVLSIGKKNGKSTLIATLGLFFGATENNQQIFSIALTRDQAAITWKMAAQMIEQNAYLAANTIVRPSKKSIYFKKTKSEWFALSSDGPAKNGLNCSILIHDEAFFSQDSNLRQNLQSGMIARKNSLVLSISTAGDSLTSAGYELYERAKKIASGEIKDPSFLSMLFESDESIPWDDERTWLAANPTLKEIPELFENIRKECRYAKDFPSEKNKFIRYFCNRWCISTINNWIDPDLWKACKKFNPDDLIGFECYAGIDVSSTNDISALVLLFPLDNGFAVIPHFYLPENNIQKLEKQHKAPYSEWAKQGLITLTPGDVIDYEYIRADLNRFANLYRIKEVAIDRVWNSVYITTNLIGDGLNVIPTGSGALTLTPTMKLFERLILSENIFHNDNPILTWMAANVVAKQDSNGGLTPDKNKSKDKIDGIMSILYALTRATTTPTEVQVTSINIA